MPAELTRVLCRAVEGRAPPPEAALPNAAAMEDVLVLNKVRGKMFETFDNLRTAFLSYDHDRSGVWAGVEHALIDSRCFRSLGAE